MCFVALGFVVVAGCFDSPLANKEVPAPVGENTDYEFVGAFHQNLGGDCFEARGGKGLHCVSLRGVDTPKEGQPYFGKSAKALRTMLIGRNIRIHVVSHDECMIELADAFVVNEDPADRQSDLNLALELIRMGFGWYDGSEFGGSEIYRDAENEARENRFGLWSQDNPIPPWEFEERQKPDAGSKNKLQSERRRNDGP